MVWEKRKLEVISKATCVGPVLGRLAEDPPRPLLRAQTPTFRKTVCYRKMKLCPAADQAVRGNSVCRPIFCKTVLSCKMPSDGISELWIPKWQPRNQCPTPTPNWWLHKQPSQGMLQLVARVGFFLSAPPQSPIVTITINDHWQLYQCPRAQPKWHHLWSLLMIATQK